MAAVKKAGQKAGGRSGAAKAKAPSPKKNPGGKSRTPFLVLIILMLLTAMVVIINRTERDRIFNPPRKTENAVEKKIEAHQIIEIKEKEEPQKKETVENEEKKQPAPAERLVNVYFIKINEVNEKISLVPVKRKVNDDTFMKDTLVELLRGPSAYEKKRGYISAIPDNLKLRSVQIKGKNAVLDFNPALGDGAVGDILLGRLDQIVYTATQFKEIESVEITINGKKQKTIGADGLSISGPLHRRH